jgi:hypothetical protein
MSEMLNDAFLKAVDRHFVTMSCMQTPAGSIRSHVVVSSGFVINVQGLWFYITAGHIVRDIQTAVAAGSKFDVWRFGDQSAGEATPSPGVPFDYVAEEWIVIRDEAVGTDYAALWLRDLYRAALEQGGVIPLGKETWGDHVTEYDQWVLVGVPKETVFHDGESTITAKLKCVAVEECDLPETAGERAQNQFYARLMDGSESVIENVDGMSGGPIFATKRCEDGLRYKVIGIQSAWYKSTRTIAACPFASLGYGIETAVNELLHSLTGRGLN